MHTHTCLHASKLSMWLCGLVKSISYAYNNTSSCLSDCRSKFVLVSCQYSDNNIETASDNFSIIFSQKQLLFCKLELSPGSNLNILLVVLLFCIFVLSFLSLFVFFPSFSFFFALFPYQTAGGPECDFLVHAVNNEQGSSKWVGLECAIAPGYHIGVLPTGQLGSPAYTTLENTASHFSVECVQVRES